jgi:Uncharacterized protein conserved in bacteria (DUF2059)
MRAPIDFLAALWFATFFLYAFNPCAAQAQTTVASVAEEYARKAGLDRQLESLAKGTAEQFAADLSGNPNMSPERRRRVIEAATLVFTAKRMGQSMRTQLARHAREEDLKTAAAFYDTALGKRIVAAELSHAAADPNVMQKRAADLSATFAIDEPNRYPLARRLEASLRSTDFVLNTVELMAVAALRGAAASSGANRAVEIEKLRQQIHAENAQIGPQLRPIIVASGSLMYAPLSDEELLAYVVQTESAAGLRVTQAVFKSFEGMFEELGAQLMQQLAAKR